MKYGVVNYPVKVIDEEIINALADIEIHHEEDKRIVLVECVISGCSSQREIKTFCVNG